LDSLKAQNYPKELLELLIVDGGSSDSTLEIAGQFGAKLISEPRLKNNPEARKAIGLASAKNELVLYIDSDNILPHKDWLVNMVKPLVEDEEVVAVWTLRYHYDKRASLLNRYFALFGVNDPIAYYFNKRDRLSWAENKWNLLGRAIEKKDYYVVSFANNKIPTLGANGYLIRRSVLNRAKVEQKYFFHIDVNADLVLLGFNKFACIKDTIMHLSADNLISFLRKRLNFMRVYHQEEYGLRRWRLFEKEDLFKLLVFVFYGLTLFKPLYDGFRGYLKIRDKAWFLHAVVCFAIIFVYGWGLISRSLKLKTNE
jgi:glycosyltransferase involved in cell wall biosynthesis